jgi:hypothetical protein
MVGRNMSLKNPVTPPGIDPETVRIVAQRLNHYATPGPERSGSIALYLGGKALDICHFEERQKLEYNIKIYFEKLVMV